MIITTNNGNEVFIEEDEIASIIPHNYVDKGTDKYNIDISFFKAMNVLLQCKDKNEQTHIIKQISDKKAKNKLPINALKEDTYIDGFKAGCEYTLSIQAKA